MFGQNARPAGVRGRRWRVIGLCAVMLGWTSPFALAQPQQTAPTLQKPDTDAPKPGETQKAPSSTLPSTGENLSETLGRSGGVIRPPGNIDPEISVPPKDPGAGSSMPVIPPPGSPGGDQSVKPK